MEEFITIGGQIPRISLEAFESKNPNVEKTEIDDEGKEIVVQEKLTESEYMNKELADYITRITNRHLKNIAGASIEPLVLGV